MSSDTDVPSILKRGPPDAVTYDLTAPGHVTITLPPRSTWSSGLHWHEGHDEYLKVVQGSIRVTLGDGKHILTATKTHHPEVKVPRHTWHSWERAGGVADGDDDVVVVERTEPVDLQKAVFFWNIHGAVLGAPGLSDKLAMLPARVRALVVDAWVTLCLLVIFHYLDNFPVLVDAPGLLRRRLAPALQTSPGMMKRTAQRVDCFVTHVVLWTAACVGWVLGVKPVRREFTPASVFSRWNEHEKKLS